MGKRLRPIVIGLVALGLGLLFIALFTQASQSAVLNPRGLIAAKERSLMVWATLLMLVIIVPVFGLTFFIARKYRAENTKATYRPEWDGDKRLESLWWGFPLAIILVLSVITWRSSHELDPFKPIQASAATMHIQVVALDWKWLFIYPNQKIATVNYVEVPQNVPIDFEITADAPMNSFWIPQLGGQMYAMSGMSTHLNLMATSTGDFRGSSANISGRGFAGMKFTAKSVSSLDFAHWQKSAAQSSSRLDKATYTQLAKPSQNSAPATYALTDTTLYTTIMAKYMAPGDGMSGMDHMDMDHMK